MKRTLVLSLFGALALLVSACGAASPTPAGPSPTPTALVPLTGGASQIPGAGTASPALSPAAGTQTGSGTEVRLGSNTSLGSFLVDSKGMTLYLYTRDTPNVSNCGGGCVDYWPPLLTNGAPAAGDGVDASLLGSIERSDGTTQVTYNGWPLYYYIGDSVPGDAKGENVQNIWFVVTAQGEKR